MEKNNWATLLIIQLTLSFLWILLGFMLPAILTEIKNGNNTNVLVTYRCTNTETNVVTTWYKDYSRSEFQTSVLWKYIEKDIKIDGNSDWNCVIENITSY